MTERHSQFGAEHSHAGFEVRDTANDGRNLNQGKGFPENRPPIHRIFTILRPPGLGIANETLVATFTPQPPSVFNGRPVSGIPW